MTQTNYDFAGKYESKNWVSQRLVAGFFNALARELAGFHGGRLLEIGCGEGYSTRFIADLVASRPAELYACDIELRLLRSSQVRSSKTPLAQASAYSLCHPDKSFDWVVALEVLEHLDDPIRGLREIARVCRGQVITSVPREPLWRCLNMMRGKYWSALGNTPGHLQHWSSQEFVNLISQYGKVIAVSTPLPWTVVRWLPD